MRHASSLVLAALAVRGHRGRENGEQRHHEQPQTITQPPPSSPTASPRSAWATVGATAPPRR
jgi:hypothetical protein